MKGRRERKKKKEKKKRKKEETKERRRSKKKKKKTDTGEKQHITDQTRLEATQWTKTKANHW